MRKKNGFSQFISDCKEKKLVAFGASVFLQVIAMNYEELDLKNAISYIVDNDSKKNGTRYSLLDADKEVHSLEYLLNEDLSNIVILISTDAYAYEIYRQLENIDKLEDTVCYCLPTMIETNEDDKTLHSLSRDEERIPKIIHCFWFSGSPKDDLSKRCIESWRKYCPDYEIKEWNSENYDVTKSEYMYEAYKQKMWAYAADYARLDTVYNYGGFYFDMDLELTRNIDELLSADFVGGFGPIRDVELAAFGAKRNSPLVRKMLDSYENKVFIGKDVPLMEVQPVLMDKLMKEYGFKINGKFQNIDNQILYPRYSFSPRNWFTGETIDYEGSFGIHHCAGGWISKDKINESRHENMKELSRVFGMD